MAKETETILSRHLDIPSKWSGKIHFSEEDLWQKEWNCDILTSYNTNPSILLHEQIHARSISLFGKEGPIIFAKNRMEEESAVQLLTEEICKKEGIIFEKSYYDNNVNALRRINKEFVLFDSDYEFAKELIKIPPQDRQDWLIELATKRKDFEKYKSFMSLWKEVIKDE